MADNITAARPIIEIRPDRKYYGYQRHFSRAANPPPGKIWDWNVPLAAKAAGQAARMREGYFGPDVLPFIRRASPIPRAGQTVELMWGTQELGEIIKTETFGPANEATADQEWHKSQDLEVTSSGAECYAADPELTERVTQEALATVRGDIKLMKGGEFGWGGSHCPYADTVLRLCREELLGLPANTGWLPGQFGSGAFAWLSFGLDNKLVGAEYYPTL